MTTLFLFLLLHVRGVVVDPAARPIEGAKIACGSETVNTDSTGKFELASDKCDATVTKDGFAPQTIHLDDSKSAEIKLSIAPTNDRVLVTATGAPIAAEEAGVSSTVFTARDFAIRQNPAIADYLRDVPGIDVVQTGSTGGITSLFSHGGDSSSTMVLLDGVPLTEPGGSMDFTHLMTAGIDRVEVVSGPESALFGAEAASGVVQLFSHRGDAESNRVHGSFSYERGSFSTDHWTAQLDGGLARKIDYSFTADQFRTTGEYPNNAYRITTGAMTLGYRFSDRTSISGTFRDLDSRTGVPGQTYYGLFDLLAQETARDSTIALHLDDVRSKRFVEHVTFGYHRRNDLFNDPTGEVDYNLAAAIRTVPANPVPYVFLAALLPPNATVAPPGTTLVSTVGSVFGDTSLTLTDRTDVGYQGALTHNGGTLVFGYQFERQAGEISGSNVDRFDNGFFVHEQYAITPRIFVTAGARVQQSNVFGTEFTPRGSITYRAPTDTFFRFSASRGITEPSLLENYANESFFVGNRNLKPEKTASYEVGVFHEWFGRRLRTDAAFFRNSFHDLIEFDFTNFPGTFLNVDRSWAHGGQGSATFRINRFTRVRGAYTRNYTRITGTNSTDLGQQLLRQPLNSGSISVELTPRKFAFIIGTRFIGERRDNDFVFGITRAQGYEYVYLSGSWQLTPHLAPFVRIENAADEKYQEALGYAALTRAAYGGLKLSW